MDWKAIVVGAASGVFVLAGGLIWGAAMLLMMNGVHPSKAGPITTVYLVLLGLCVLGGAFLSGWGSRAIAHAGGWSMWIVGPLAVLVVCLIGAAVLFFGGLATMVVLGVK